MTLAQISDASQAIASFAVVVSLVFLAVQVRQSTEQGKQANRLARAQVTAEIRNSFNDLFRRTLTDRDLCTAIMSLADHSRTIDERQMPQLSSLCFNLMGVARQAHELFRSGLVDAWALRDVEQQLFHLISHPTFHALYRSMVGVVDPSTVTEDDRAWVRHINDRLKYYQSALSEGPYLAAMSGAPAPKTES
jgi:hypothetical protein